MHQISKLYDIEPEKVSFKQICPAIQILKTNYVKEKYIIYIILLFT